MWTKIQNNPYVHMCVLFTYITYAFDCDSRIEMRIPLIHCYRIMCSLKCSYTQIHDYDVLNLMRTYSLSLSLARFFSFCLLLFPFRSFIWLSMIIYTLAPLRTGLRVKTFMCVQSWDTCTFIVHMQAPQESKCELWNGEDKPTDVERKRGRQRTVYMHTHTHTRAYNTQTRI